MLEEKTIPGLHQAAFVELSRFLKGPATIMDLGAGSGAWAARLQKSGFTVQAIERNAQGFKAKDIPVFAADLNQNFSSVVQDRFSALTAIEVIEHLENPRHFLRECRKLLKNEGILFITTPNIECTPGRLRFLLSGNFRMFDRSPSFNDMTHISPIQTFMFEKMVDDCGFEMIFHGFNHSRPTITRFLFAMVCFLMEPFLRGVKGGDNHLFVLKKKRNTLEGSL